MPNIGVLLPRSTEYPSIGFDILDGLKIHLRQLQVSDINFHIENLGFGENVEANHALAEKLVMTQDVDMLVVYATSLNAESLYSFAESSGKPILFLDAGMEHFESLPSQFCYHLTLQGTQACALLGAKAAQQAKQIAFAASFLDGGYRGGWFMHEALTKAGSITSGHYVSLYRPEEFSLANLENIMQKTETEAVAASFSSYLAGLFLTHLKNSGSDKLKNVPIYCSPFLAEEMQLESSPFPDARLYTMVPWARAIESTENQIFIDTIKKEKNKTANIFHLLGWEAAIAVQRILKEGIVSLKNYSFLSPRGMVCFHPETHASYAPLYEGQIVRGANNNCKLALTNPVEISAETHRINHFTRPLGEYSRWKNNFFCI